MKVRRNSVSFEIKDEVVEMTHKEIIKLLMSGDQYIVHKPDIDDLNYDLDIMNYDGYVE